MVTVRDTLHLRIWLALQSKWKMELHNPRTDLCSTACLDCPRKSGEIYIKIVHHCGNSNISLALVVFSNEFRNLFHITPVYNVSAKFTLH